MRRLSQAVVGEVGGAIALIEAGLAGAPVSAAGATGDHLSRLGAARRALLVDSGRLLLGDHPQGLSPGRR
jgi:hypothetical protein